MVYLESSDDFQSLDSKVSKSVKKALELATQTSLKNEHSLTEVLTEVSVATKILKIQRKTTFSEKTSTKTLKSTPSHTTDHPP